jgi:hypothetical protein
VEKSVHFGGAISGESAGCGPIEKLIGHKVVLLKLLILSHLRGQLALDYSVAPELGKPVLPESGFAHFFV